MWVSLRLLPLILTIYVFAISISTANMVPVRHDKLKLITVVLDWTPNTNHTGVVVAQKLGYYKKQGLKIKIIQPGKNSAEQIVARGFAQFGFSSSESVIIAAVHRLPILSVMAVINYNTSGFYTLNSSGIKTPADFYNKLYGAYVGSLFELNLVKAMMRKAGSKILKFRSVVVSGGFHLLASKKVDFIWGFAGWQGIKYKQMGIKVNFIPVTCYLPNSYTPVIITNNYTLNKRPKLIQQFIQATSKGYMYAINHPKKAAKILSSAYPSLNLELVYASQKYLSHFYKKHSKYFGYQSYKVWNQYIEWMYINNIIKKKIDPNLVFSNFFVNKIYK